MSWKCPDCGFANSDDTAHCNVCGFSEELFLSLTFTSGKNIQVNIATTIGCNTWKGYDDDAHFLDKKQFTLEQDSENNWVITPAPDTTNETILNGKSIMISTILQDGDIIGVGREAKGVVKVPVTIQLVS